MAKSIQPYQDDRSKKSQIRSMFDNIAHRYDFLNHFLSVGIDRVWRKTAVKQIASLHPKRILDMATGTADLAVALHKSYPEAEINGIDLSPEMIRVGQEKIARKNIAQISLAVGDAEALEAPSNHYDAATVAFGVRNFENLQKGLKELHRVLRPDGRLVVLEFSQPRGMIFRPIFMFYFKNILPLYGKFISKDPKAYEYLFESVQSFPAYENFMAELQSAGFKTRYYKQLTFGVCCVYVADK
jgi:demethylmenaquinone methyltransferase/2-methoxy-6-polyprenyl-1,4-benzoquinol methylase